MFRMGADNLGKHPLGGFKASVSHHLHAGRHQAPGPVVTAGFVGKGGPAEPDLGNDCLCLGKLAVRCNSSNSRSSAGSRWSAWAAGPGHEAARTSMTIADTARRGAARLRPTICGEKKFS